jgi:hypothetical protein
MASDTLWEREETPSYCKKSAHCSWRAELIHTVKDLGLNAAWVAALEHGTRASPAPAPAHARVAIEQWTVRLSREAIAWILDQG